MVNMFNGCSALTSLDVSGFNTKLVKSMAGTFRGCIGITALDLSTWDTQNVNSQMWGSAFGNMNGLSALYVGSNFAAGTNLPTAGYRVEINDSGLETKIATGLFYYNDWRVRNITIYGPASAALKNYDFATGKINVTFENAA